MFKIKSATVEPAPRCLKVPKAESFAASALHFEKDMINSVQDHNKD